MNFELRTLDLAKLLYLLSSTPRISTQSLIRKSGLPKNHLYSILKNHSNILSAPSRYLSIKSELREKVLTDSQELINNIKNIDDKNIKKILYPALSLRPLANRQLDQFYATKSTTFRRAQKMAEMGDLYQRNIAFLGDDDFTSIACALTHQAKSITVFEIDDRLIDIIEKVSDENKLNVKVIKQDLLKDFDKKFLHTFDTIFTDPPYTPGGISLFVNRAVELLIPQLTSRLYLCYGNSDRAREREVVIQKTISDFGFLTHTKDFQFNHYTGAQSIGSSSSLYLLDWTPQTKTLNRSFDKIYTYEKNKMDKNFPFYNHWEIEMTVLDTQIIDENYVDSLIKIIVNDLKLTVVSSNKHLFPSYGGLTKVYILSQSHLVVHTWPEASSIHFDLMTCSSGVNSTDVKAAFSSLPHTNQPIFR